MYHVFISYPHEEFDIAKRIYDALKNHFLVFMDKYSLVAGADWTKAIVTAQKQSAMTIAIISNNTKHACYENDEITRAIYLRKHHKHIIVPIVVSNHGKNPEIPFGLQNTQHIVIDSRHDIAQVLAQITDAMKSNVERFGFSSEVASHMQPEYQAQADSEQHYQRHLNDQIREEEILGFFLRRIQRHSYRKTFLFAFVDVQKFTQINVIYGKRCADDVLRTIEKIIADSPETIYCHRLFSDEFSLLIPGCRLERGFRVMESLQKAIYLYGWDAIAHGLRVSTTIGISEMKLDRGYTKTDVKEGIVRAALGCAAIDEIVDSFYEIAEEPLPPVRFPRRVKGGPKHLTQDQVNTPLRKRCS